MKVSVSHEEAYELILRAIEEAKNINAARSDHAECISRVILGSHLTYRYILLTGLLAKATNGLVNPLALQANAEVEGAYDARSLCHAVIVGRVEDTFLQGRLGASNEPFLNKPARFPTHSILNPARNGEDKRLQAISVKILESAVDKNTAYGMLVDAVFFVLKRNNRVIDIPEISTLNFAEFVEKTLTQGIDGESCAVVTSLAFNILAERNGWRVVSHPVNQAGTSSKEILDIDIYQQEKPIIAVEVKDKEFIYSDVNHATNKALSAGVRNIIFIKGPRAKLLNSSESEMIESTAKKGALLTFIEAKDFASTCYALNGNLHIEKIANYLNIILKSIRAKDRTVEHVTSSLK